MGGLVCAVHRRKNKGFPTLKRTLNLGIEKGRLLKNSRPKGGLIQVICYPASPETVDITGFFEKFCIAIRTNGSIDIAGAARSILAVTRTANKQNPAERYLVQVKSNLAPMGSAILFEVADKGVNFLDELELNAEDAFSASAPRMGRPNAREEAATDFIRSLLAGGRRLASDCEAKLEAAGFKKSTYKKSKKKAGVRSVKDGFLWYWTLPEVEKPIENGQEVTDEDDLPI